MRKVYKVIFNKYSNVLQDAVSHNTKNMEYISIPRNVPFLIFEDEITKYQEYGGGFESLVLVGEMQDDAVYHPPCEDCNTKMDEIRSAYDRMKELEACKIEA